MPRSGASLASGPHYNAHGGELYGHALARLGDTSLAEEDGGSFIGIPGRLVCNLNAAVLRPSVTRLLIKDSGGAEILSADLAS
ncbi:MAG: hypothetical protein ACR2LP_04900 [Candidatus Limnocylindrales bacterium]